MKNTSFRIVHSLTQISLVVIPFSFYQINFNQNLAVPGGSLSLLSLFSPSVILSIPTLPTVPAR